MNIEEVRDALSRRSAISGEGFGNYALFINQAENLFRRSFQVPLEEYGLPLQLTDKIVKFFDDVESIDEALERIRNLPSNSLGLEPFERELLDECKPYL
jgi:hypothetical protein